MLHHTTGISFFDCGASGPVFSFFLHFTFMTHFFAVMVFMDNQVDRCIKLAQPGLAFVWFKSNHFMKNK